jgi:hypothetical protein
VRARLAAGSSLLRDPATAHFGSDGYADGHRPCVRGHKDVADSSDVLRSAADIYAYTHGDAYCYAGSTDRDSDTGHPDPVSHSDWVHDPSPDSGNAASAAHPDGCAHRDSAADDDCLGDASAAGKRDRRSEHPGGGYSSASADSRTDSGALVTRAPNSDVQPREREPKHRDRYVAVHVEERDAEPREVVRGDEAVLVVQQSSSRYDAHVVGNTESGYGT